MTCFKLADAASFLSQGASSGTRPAGSSSAATELRSAVTDTEWVPMDFRAALTCSCLSPGDLASSYAVNAKQLYFLREVALQQLLISARSRYLLT